ncbi:uncharacterized protein LOC119161393 [Rhipicephalus microplus]|uniref:uncharacterized protein LOC119161393 n=1 Tax=Rhipicephalus microplus TaxID=6941 RepID=UPI003F6A62BE
MEGEAKVRGSRCRRRERAARMQKQAMRGGQSADEADESPGRSASKPPRPPNRKKRNKEPIFEEDVIDGFAILSFRTYEDLESTIKSREPETRPSSPEPLLNSKINCNDKHPPASSPTPPRTKTKPARTSLNKVRKGSSRVASDENSRPPGAGGPETPPASINSRTQQLQTRSASGDRLSDCSTRSSSGRGYMCDSESDSERVSALLPLFIRCSTGLQLVWAPSRTSEEHTSHEVRRSTPGARRYGFIRFPERRVFAWSCS